MTVILPTHNGGDTIGRTLDAFCCLEQPEGGWMFVLIDNASTDCTKEIAIRQLEQATAVVHLRGQDGKSYALNSGIEHARGDFVIFTDDDVLPDPNWLSEWRRVANQYPEFGIFGGAIEPAFESQPPRWLEETSWAIVLYTATKRGRLEGAMTPGDAEVFGPNMAVRMDVLAGGLRFDGRLMVGKSGMLGDETEFVDRVIAAGRKVAFAPTARVRHIVQSDQVKLKWMLNRFYRHGRTMYFLDWLHGRATFPTICGVPRFLIRRIATRFMLLPFVLASFDGFRIVSKLRLIAYDLGALTQSRLLAHTPMQPGRGDTS